MSQDFYNLLWVDKNASPEELKKAYRKKAMELHPDRHGGDKEKEAEFKRVNEAYATLSDTQKRANYDRYGSADGPTGFSGGFGGQGFGGGVEFDMGDIFESFFWQGFGGGSRGWKKKRDESGEDIETQIRLTFADAIFGTKKTISLNKKIVCHICHGSGAKEWSKPKPCTTCHGSGHVRTRSQTFFWVVEQTAICPACHGTGEVIENVCDKCRGEKRINVKEDKEITVPAGIDNEMTVKLTGEGNEWTNGRNGDLYITFFVPDSFEWLKRDDMDLHYAIAIDPIEAVLGIKKKLKIPVIGERTIEIDSGTQHGETIKLKWDGVKHIQKDIKGDLIITIHISIPKKLSKKEHELYMSLAKEKKLDINEKGFLGKLFD